jgi:hypothetical protein
VMVNLLTGPLLTSQFSKCDWWPWLFYDPPLSFILMLRPPGMMLAYSGRMWTSSANSSTKEYHMVPQSLMAGSIELWYDGLWLLN